MKHMDQQCNAAVEHYNISNVQTVHLRS